MCKQAVKENIWTFEYVPDKLKAREMCEQAVSKKPWMIVYVPDEFITQEMCEQAVSRDPRRLSSVPDLLVTQEMCEQGPKEDDRLFKYVPDWFVTAEMIKNYKDKEWVRSYKLHKSQKAKIIKELLPIAWHPDCVIGWCFDEDQKETLEKLLEDPW